MSNFIINTVRIKNRNVEYMLHMDIDDNAGKQSDSVVRLKAWNNEYVLEEMYGMPNRDAARSFIEHHSSEFIKAELVRLAIEVSPEAIF